MAEQSPSPYDTSEGGVCGIFNLYLYLSCFFAYLVPVEQCLFHQGLQRSIKKI
jgi:hypothetical protein